MLETFKKNIWLIAVSMVVLALLSVAGNYYFKKKDLAMDDSAVIKKEVVTEKALDAEERFNRIIKEEEEKCALDFDFDKLDFTEVDSDSELSSMLKGLLVMRAVDQNNKNLCDYEKQEVDLGLRKERCEEDYNFFFILTDKLRSGLDYRQYIQECQDVLLAYTLIRYDMEDADVLKQATELECAIFYQSFQDKTPIVIEPEKICYADSIKHDSVDYFDSQTKQIKSCFTEIAGKIKFLVAVANNDLTGCLDIKQTRAFQYCQYYFNKDLANFYDKFRESYCNDKVYKSLSSTK